MAKNLAKGDIEEPRGIKTDSKRTFDYYASFEPPEQFNELPGPNNFNEEVELFTKKYIEGPLGGDLDQGSIYIQGDQGKGDVIQFNISAAEDAGNKITRIELPSTGSSKVMMIYYGENKYGNEIMTMIRTMSPSQYSNLLKEIKKKREEEMKKMEEEKN